MIEEFITYKGCIYKKIGELGCIIKQCLIVIDSFLLKNKEKNIAVMLAKQNIGEKNIKMPLQNRL